MEKKKNYIIIILGSVLLVASILFCFYSYRSTYTQSLEISKEISDLKKTVSDIEAGSATGDLDALKGLVTAYNQDKLNLERPYSYGLTVAFLSLLLLAKGIWGVVKGNTVSQKIDVQKLAQASLLAALCYIGFAFFKIDIYVGPEKTAIHFGNIFCVLAALLLGGYRGGMAGAVGMTIADLTTAYVTSAPKTFLLKLCIGLIVGFVAHKLFKLTKAHSPKAVLGITVLASFCGMLFNVIADPFVGYLYKTYLLGLPQDLAKALAKVATISTGINAVVAVILASLFYVALRPALKKTGLLAEIHLEGTEK